MGHDQFSQGRVPQRIIITYAKGFYLYQKILKLYVCSLFQVGPRVTKPTLLETYGTGYLSLVISLTITKKSYTQLEKKNRVTSLPNERIWENKSYTHLEKINPVTRCF